MTTTVMRLRRLPLPCPLNQLYRSVLIPGQRWPRQILSARARVCRDRLVGAILAQLGRVVRPIFAGPVSVSDCTIVPPDRRPRDIDAYFKQLFDCLAKAGVVADDKQIKHVAGCEMMEPERPGWIDITINHIQG